MCIRDRYRVELADQLHHAVVELNDDSFLVKRHRRYVELFRNRSAWNSLETIEMSNIKEHIAPLIKPGKEDELARRFDYQMCIRDRPPLDLQNQFADFVNQVNKSKVAVQKALDETQTLFDSLMQKYFG